VGIEEEGETLEVIYLKDGQWHCLACEGGQVEGGVCQPQIMRAMQLNFPSKEHECLKALRFGMLEQLQYKAKGLPYTCGGIFLLITSILCLVEWT
jgi:hypothetical protein